MHASCRSRATAHFAGAAMGRLGAGEAAVDARLLGGVHAAGSAGRTRVHAADFAARAVGRAATNAGVGRIHRAAVEGRRVGSIAASSAVAAAIGAGGRWDVVDGRTTGTAAEGGDGEPASPQKRCAEPHETTGMAQRSFKKATSPSVGRKP
jgi:hypothetical protein